jgi:hypothetical protein
MNKFLQELVPVDLADHIPRIVVIGNVGGVFGEKIAYDLIDGVIALFVQCVEDGAQNPAHLCGIVVGHGELNGIVVRHKIDLLCIFRAIITEILFSVKCRGGKFWRI